MSFRQDYLCSSFQFARLVFDKLTLNFKLEAIGLVLVFNNVVYNIEDLAADASYQILDHLLSFDYGCCDAWKRV